MLPIVLASASPRRKAILTQIGLGDFPVIEPQIEEIYDNRPPEDLVAAFSRLKAENVAKSRAPEEIIIAADTVVFANGHVLAKPTTEKEAISSITALSGHWHSVYTGLTVIHRERVITREEITSVKFRDLTAFEIETYVQKGESFDKAAGYGIQGIGALLVERVEGDFYNVMGLPLYCLSKILKEFDINLLTSC